MFLDCCLIRKMEDILFFMGPEESSPYVLELLGMSNDPPGRITILFLRMTLLDSLPLPPFSDIDL